jgi:hypothetical protein
MRISQKRGSWILQFANENRTCVTGAPRPVRLMSAYGHKADITDALGHVRYWG